MLGKENRRLIIGYKPMFLKNLIKLLQFIKICLTKIKYIVCKHQVCDGWSTSSNFNA